jgi:DNA-directed RNA polymerase subunit M/transcription elongation factor TFIIS
VSPAGGFRGILRALIRPKVLRTCEECGFEWKVPRYYANPQIRAALTAKARSPLASKRARALAARRSQEMEEVGTAYAHCPRCGKEKFAQRRLRVQSREVYLGIERY